jgi:L-cysteine:1D-myo-inositol 2-amino-2-deoxy-alpha-D-glucopyranoside ligase
VRLDGEKMSKSLGNLVFVSSLLATGTDPMAIRLAILAHHYRDDWDWTVAGLAVAERRLARWRVAVDRLLASPPDPASPVGAQDPLSPIGAQDPLSPIGAQDPLSPIGEPDPASPAGAQDPASQPGALAAAEAVLAAVRERMADDLDAPGALAAVDAWAEEVTGATVLPPDARAAALLVGDAVDALLGVGL